MDMMERIVLDRRAPARLGNALSLAIIFAVFVLGAPPIVFIPIAFGGTTAYLHMRQHVLRRLDRH